MFTIVGARVTGRAARGVTPQASQGRSYGSSTAGCAPGAADVGAGSVTGSPRGAIRMGAGSSVGEKLSAWDHVVVPVSLVLTSDTHVPKRSRDLPHSLWCAIEAADVVVHAGDWIDAALLDLFEERSRRLIGVYGNN